MEDLLPNAEIENDKTELLAEHTINACCVKLLRFEGYFVAAISIP